MKTHHFSSAGILWATCSAVLLLSACYKPARIDNIATKDRVFAIPLAYSNFDVHDLLEANDNSNDLRIDDDGLLSLVYRGEIYSFSVDKQIEIPNQGFAQSLDLASDMASQLAISGSIDMDYQSTQGMTVLTHGAKLSRLSMRKGQLLGTASHSIGADVTLDIEISNLLDAQGLPYQKTIFFPGGDKTPKTWNVDISAYSFVFDPSFEAPLGLELHQDLHLSEASGMTAQPGEEVSIHIDLEDLAYETMWGNVGKQLYAQDSDTINIGLFGKSLNGLLELAAPEAQFFIKNSIGIPIQLDIASLQTLNEQNGNMSTLLSGGDHLLGYPGDENAGPSSTLIALNQNSDPGFNLLFNDAPNQFITAIQATSHPENDTLSNSDFLRYDAGISMDIDLNLPLVGRIENLIFQDTFDLNLGMDPGFIKWAEFQSVAKNRFPFDVSFQLYFLDAMDNKIDSLFTEPTRILAAADIDLDGRVDNIQKLSEQIYADGKKIEHILSAKKIYLIGTGNTTGSHLGKHVKIYEDYNLDYSLGMKFNSDLAF